MGSGSGKGWVGREGGWQWGGAEGEREWGREGVGKGEEEEEEVLEAYEESYCSNLDSNPQPFHLQHSDLTTLLTTPCTTKRIEKRMNQAKWLTKSNEPETKRKEPIRIHTMIKTKRQHQNKQVNNNNNKKNKRKKERKTKGTDEDRQQKDGGK